MPASPATLPIVLVVQDTQFDSQRFARLILRNDPQGAYALTDRFMQQKPHREMMVRRAVLFLNTFRDACLPTQIKAPILAVRVHLMGDQLTYQVKTHNTVLAKLELAWNISPEEQSLTDLLARAQANDPVACFKLCQCCVQNPHKLIKDDWFLKKIQDAIPYGSKYNQSWELAELYYNKAFWWGSPAAFSISRIIGSDKCAFIAPCYRAAITQANPRTGIIPGLTLKQFDN